MSLSNRTPDYSLNVVDFPGTAAQKISHALDNISIAGTVPVSVDQLRIPAWIRLKDFPVSDHSKLDTALIEVKFGAAQLLSHIWIGQFAHWFYLHVEQCSATVHPKIRRIFDSRSRTDNFQGLRLGTQLRDIVIEEKMESEPVFQLRFSDDLLAGFQVLKNSHTPPALRFNDVSRRRALFNLSN